MIMCLSCRWKEIKLSFWEKKDNNNMFFFHYLADDFLYWLQPYAQSLLWTPGVQQEDPLVSSLWSLNGLCKPQEAKGGVSCGVQLQNHVCTRASGALCVWMKCVCCAYTRRAGVERQTRLCWLQQPLYESAGEDGGGEDDGPFSMNLHRLHYTVRDQVLLVTWGDRNAHTNTHTQMVSACFKKKKKNSNHKEQIWCSTL